MANPQGNTPTAGLPSGTRSKAGLTRGHTFQDVVAAGFLLEVLFGEAETLTIEGALANGDKFDDLVLRRPDEVICLQVKNGPEHRLTGADLTGSSSRGLELEELKKSASARLEASAGDRFIVLTSFENETTSTVTVEDSGETFTVLSHIERPTRTLEDEEGQLSENHEIEFVTGFPDVGTADDLDKETLENISRTPLFKHLLEAADPLLQDAESIAVPSVKSLIDKTILAANRIRGSFVGRELTRADIARHLELLPEQRLLPQDFPVDRAHAIRPHWVTEIAQRMQGSGERVILQGQAGTGKSTGTELLSEDLKASARVVRVTLYRPDDPAKHARRRLSDQGVRETLAGSLASALPEAFEEEDTTSPIWISHSHVQGYLQTIARWSSEANEAVAIIIDGLDHAIRQGSSSQQSEPSANAVLQDLASLEFPDRLNVLIVSRPLQDEVLGQLETFDEIDIPRWIEAETNTYLDTWEQSTDEELDQALRSRAHGVSGGLPVILGHLMRKAHATESESFYAGLRESVESAGDVSGELDEYYRTLWENLKPAERDAVVLTALGPAGVPMDAVNHVLSQPWCTGDAALEAGGLGHVLDRDGRRLKPFHDSFRAHALDELRGTQDGGERTLHESLSQYFLEQATELPGGEADLELHARHADRPSYVLNLVDLPQLFRWLENGALWSEIQGSLQRAFRVACNHADYETAFETAYLLGYGRELSTVHVDHWARMEYLLAAGCQVESIRLSQAVIQAQQGSAEALRALLFLAENWPGIVDEAYVEEWEDAYDEQPDHSRSAPPELYLELRASISSPERFWEIAGRIRGADGEPFPVSVIKAATTMPQVLSTQEEPPDWLTLERPDVLESLWGIRNELPDGWIQQLKATEWNPKQLPPGGLALLIHAGVPHGPLVASAEARDLEDLEPVSTEREVGYSNAHFLGAVYVRAGKSTDQLIERIESEHPTYERAHVLMALCGGAEAADEASRKEWVDEALKWVLESVDGTDHLQDTDAGPSDDYTYRAAIQKSTATLSPAIAHAGDEHLNRLREVVKSRELVEPWLEPFFEQFRKYWSENGPDDDLVQGLEAHLSEIINRDPEETPFTGELIEIAIQAHTAGDSNLGRRAFNTALHHGFRYGYRKDNFLEDVWDALVVASNGNLRLNIGRHIQLLNWARLLHRMTDGKGTRHMEGAFLTDFLDHIPHWYDYAIANQDHGRTYDILRDWRLENRRGLTEEKLKGLLRHERSKFYHQPVVDREPFAGIAEVALERDWPDLAREALMGFWRAGGRSDDLTADDLARLREASRKLDVEPGETPESGSRDGTDWEPPNQPEPESDVLVVLAEHSMENPIEPGDLLQFGRDTLLEAAAVIREERSQYAATSAVPLALALDRLDSRDEALQVIYDMMSSRFVMSWYFSGEGSIRPYLEALENLGVEDLTVLPLQAWADDRSGTTPTPWTVLPHLVEIVQRARGPEELDRFLGVIMEKTRRLFYPHEDKEQVWGGLLASQ